MKRAGDFLRDNIGHMTFPGNASIDPSTRHWFVPVFCRTGRGAVVIGDIELDEQGHIVFSPSREQIVARRAEVDCSLVGEWRASVYGPEGSRADWSLLLRPNGEFERLVVWRSGSRSDRGQWSHDKEESLLCLHSKDPEVGSEVWWVLQIRKLEESNATIVLRRVVVASRNLPILFYRVHIGDTAAIQEGQQTCHPAC